MWIDYRFEDGKIIEFCKIGDHLGWMLDNQVSALKRIVEEAEGGRNEKQIKGYIQQLIDAGYLENS